MFPQPLVTRRGGGVLPRFRSGVYYGTPGVTTLATNVPTLNQVHYTPFWVTAGEPFDRICCNVATLAATALTRLGIYADDGHNAPGALLLDAGTVDCSTTGDKEITISFSAPSTGTIWLAAVAQTAAATLRSHAVPWFMGGGNAAQIRVAYVQSGVAGALTDPAASLSQGNTALWVTLRAA